MKAELKIDKAGRVVIPKALRERMRMSPGSALQLTATEDKIVLKPVRKEGRFYKKGGLWVLETTTPITAEETNATIRALRDERDERNMGLR